MVIQASFCFGDPLPVLLSFLHPFFLPLLQSDVSLDGGEEKGESTLYLNQERMDYKNHILLPLQFLRLHFSAHAQSVF